MTTINLEGWALQHIWRESHGESVHQMYQRALMELPESHQYQRLRSCLVVAEAVRTGEVTVWTEEAGYNIANWARRNQRSQPELWRLHGTRKVSPCSTSGWEDWIYDDKHVIRLSSVAGHGEQAHVTYWGIEQLEDAEVA